MFKRSLASLAAVAVASGAVVAPANAMTVTVNNNKTCTIELNAEEARLISLTRTVELDKDKATLLKANYGESQLSALRAEIKKAEMELDNLGFNEARRKRLTNELKEKREKFTAYQNFRDALDACINGRNYDSTQSGVPSKPEGPSDPGPSKPEGPSDPGPSKPEGPSDPGPSKPEGPSDPGPSKPEGPSDPGPSKPEGPSDPGPSKPEGPSDPGPSKPEGERALPSTNGAVIGFIVAVLGILVAALPFIKSIFPAQLRALLP